MRGRGRGRGGTPNAYHHSQAAAAAAATAYRTYMYGTAIFGAAHPNLPLPPFYPPLMPALHHPSSRPRARGRGRGIRGGRGSFYGKRHRYHSTTVPVKKESVACKFYARGQCTNGHACLYLHEHRAVCDGYMSGAGSCQNKDDEEFEEGETACINGTHVLTEYNTPECVRYLAGLCDLGSQCLFRHTPDADNNNPCRYFVQAGVCMKGKQCEWLHTQYCRGVEDTKGCTKSKCSLIHASLYARMRSQQALWKHQRTIPICIYTQ